ncbi:MAG: ATP-dependent helicase, partial [Cyanobacteria bacterium]|nr:ATP-dependent helicase [Cyanobacteriota bacterium]MDW8202789.1 ATP-dependent helicase [Cyanobacteriota bacterium SKYGB_h_bin112]
MAVLHGTWLPQGCLFLWGEAWQRSGAVAAEELTTPVSYPFALALNDLIAELSALPNNHQLWDQPMTQIVALPTWVTASTLLPCYSASTNPPDLETMSASDIALCLYPWQITGVCLSPDAALTWLNNLPLGTMPEAVNLGGDIRLWSHIARWSLDLLARTKFLPRLESTPNGAVARWHPLLDSSNDQQRLERFSRAMPVVCR